MGNPPPHEREEARYWFPAKTYGWGWGPPCTWQGWIVLASFVVLLAWASFAFPPGRNTPGFAASVVCLTAVMLAICWWKGEPPRCRWGRD